MRIGLSKVIVDYESTLTWVYGFGLKWKSNKWGRKNLGIQFEEFEL